MTKKITRQPRTFLFTLGLLVFGLGLAPSAAAQSVCLNSCPSANDGECDDGGPGSLYAICALGSDCNDCGPRNAATDPAHQTEAVPLGTLGCDDSCPTSTDNECDDGGPASLYSICLLGTDCSDCGVRDLVADAAVIPPQGTDVTPTGTHSSAGCTNTCRWANDNECDDGGPGSLYDVCAYGTDCGDCGPRTGANPGTATPGTGQLGSAGCTNTCHWANDNECDDGGPGSLYDVCEYGTDCGDCGPRTGANPGTTTPGPGELGAAGCTNTCRWANDNECDDGGPGSLYDVCAYGTDCGDCGPRTEANPGTTTPVAPGTVDAGGCTNTCAYANDNECDDGGPDSLYDLCDYGSDCGDCGPRPPRSGPGVLPGTGQLGATGCTNTCEYANDNECDDGGVGSMFNLCQLGTDCNDCGTRDLAAVQFPAGGCENTCNWAFDGECDDGGPGSLFDVCGYGTDCGDCGPRSESGIPPGVSPPGVSSTGCANTCDTAFDGECDDGGPSSMYGICAYGSDCNDCGARDLSVPQMALGGCENTCVSAHDGVCNDGGPGATDDLCGLGTDCNDCGGPRQASDLGAATPILVAEAPPGCSNTCDTAFDSECDDGGPSSMYGICDYGTDCNDCGIRDLTIPPMAAGGCENTCVSAFDGQCNDGGAGATSDLCGLGTDCMDCGQRSPGLPSNTTPTMPPPGLGTPALPGQVCSDTCPSARDNECDDGGPASLYSICAYGSDCSDCGPRPGL